MFCFENVVFHIKKTICGWFWFIIHFEENYSWNLSNNSISLRQTCTISRHLFVDSIDSKLLMLTWKIKLREDHRKFRSLGVASIVRRRRHSKSITIAVTQKVLASVYTWWRWDRFKKKENEYHTIWMKADGESKRHQRTLAEKSSTREFSLSNCRVIKNWYIFRVPSEENHGLIQANHQRRLKGQITSEGKQCFPCLVE